MYAKRSLARSSVKHRLTDIGKITAHAAQPDIYMEQYEQGEQTF